MDDRLTKDAFEELKSLQWADNLNVEDFADENGLPLEEVERAAKSRNYQEYTQ